MSFPRLRIGTRGSPLALAQTHQLRAKLAQAHRVSEEAISVCVIRTSGDAIQDRPLAEAGGKGLFTKELDLALLNDEIDLAVHSGKDIPTLIPDDLLIPGFLERDEGERERPYEKYPWDGVSGVRPFRQFASSTTVGVY